MILAIGQKLGTLSKETSNINISSNSDGDKYLHILSVNQSGNKIETVSSNASFILDNIEPEAEITLSDTRVNEGASCTITMNVSDSQTGINQEKCKYIINESSSEIGRNVSAWDSATTFTKTPEVWSWNATEAGRTYYIHVLSVDVAGNKKEKISQGIYVAGVIELLNVNVDDNTLNPDLVTSSGEWVVVSEKDNRISPYEGSVDATVTSVMDYELSDINRVEWYTISDTWTYGAYGSLRAEVLDSSGNVVLTSNVSNYGSNVSHTLVCDVSKLKGNYKLRLKLVGKYWKVTRCLRCRIF